MILFFLQKGKEKVYYNCEVQKAAITLENVCLSETYHASTKVTQYIHILDILSNEAEIVVLFERQKS